MRGPIFVVGIGFFVVAGAVVGCRMAPTAVGDPPKAGAETERPASTAPRPAETGPADVTPQFDKQTFVYKTVQQCDIRADVYRPSFVSGQTPVILWIHGGALILGSRTDINRGQLKEYLRAGYTLVAIDYRLAPETKLPAIVEDLRDAFRWVREKGPSLFGADRDRIAAIGHSAGGYLTLMSGFSVSPRPKVLVSFYGYGDITGDWLSKPDPFYRQQPLVSRERAYGHVGNSVISETRGNRRPFYLYCRQQGIWSREVTGHDPQQEPLAFVPLCPIRNVTADYPPTLLLHGDQDTDVPYQQSAAMAAELSRLGVVHELITISSGPHVFDKDMRNPVSRKAFETVLAFLKRHL